MLYSFLGAIPVIIPVLYDSLTISWVMLYGGFSAILSKISMIYQQKRVIRQQKGVIRQRQGVILVVLYSKWCDMRGNRILAGLDGLAGSGGHGHWAAPARPAQWATSL